MNKESASSIPSHARLSAARLAAVQAVYQMQSSGQSAEAVIKEYVAHRLGKPVEGHKMVAPDAPLFSAIVEGVARREADLKGIIDAIMQDQNSAKARNSDVSVEPLLRSILLCGVFELMAHHETDAPIIITDYLEVTHAFYEGGESKLVNGVLDKAKRNLREGA